MRKIALVHDWLTGMRGGERCLEVFCELFPYSDLFTLLHRKGSLSETIEEMAIHTSVLQSLPLAKKKYRHYLPIMPWAIQRFDLSKYDLVFSSSHCVAKGVKIGPHTKHICYCYSPMRYIWDQRESYFGENGMGIVEQTGMNFFLKYLRTWDIKAAQRVDKFIAISNFVADRIKRCYGRESDVIYPPVNTSFYLLERKEPGNYFLMVSALAPYKRVDLAIEAFNRLQLPLRIIGTGQMESHLKKIAGPNIEFLGWRSDEEIRVAYAKCRAFIFPGEEDFGITPLEAQSCGKPVIASGRGGVLESVIPVNPDKKIGASGSATGLFFYKQDVESLEEAILSFQKIESDFDPEEIRKNALKFDRRKFKKKIELYLKNAIS